MRRFQNILLCLTLIWPPSEGEYRTRVMPRSTTGHAQDCTAELLTNRVMLTRRVTGLGRLSCVSDCVTSAYCDAAVYQKFLDGSAVCTLLSEVMLAGGQGQALDVSGSKSCRFIQVNPCFNGGQLYDGVCLCGNSFTGEFCEYVNPSYCNGQWNTVYSYSSLFGKATPPVLDTTQLYRAKIVFRDPSLGVVRVMTSSRVRSPSSGDFYAQSQQFLKKSTWKTFTSTAARQFVNFLKDGRYEFLTISGSTAQYTDSTADFSIVARDSVYQLNVSGTALNYQQIQEVLEEGFEVLDQNTVSVFESPKVATHMTNVILTSVVGGHFTSPPRFYNFKNFLEGVSDRVEVNLGQGKIAAVVSFTVDSMLRIGTCWMKVNCSGQRSSQNLGAYLRLGHDVRVYMDNTYYKVLEVAQVMQEFTFILAPVMSKNGTDRLDNTVLGVKSLVTSGGRFQTCTHVMEAETIQKTTSGVSSNVRWYIDTRAWSPVYSVYSNSSIASGSVQDLATGIQEGRDVRVWIKWVLETRSRFLDTQMSSLTDDGKVSTESVVTWGIDASNVTTTLLSPLCDYEYVLVTSEGYVEVMRFNIQTPGLKSVLSNVLITWFLS